MGWTYRAWKAYKRKTMVAMLPLVFVMYWLPTIKDSPWICLGIGALVVLAFFPIERSLRRQFIRSATPTREQQAAFTAHVRISNRLGIAIGLVVIPAWALYQFDGIMQPLPDWSGSALILILLLAMLLMIILSRPGHRRFEDALNWFDASWEESPLAAGNSQSDPGATSR